MSTKRLHPGGIYTNGKLFRRIVEIAPDGNLLYVSWGESPQSCCGPFLCHVTSFAQWATRKV